MPWTKSAEKRLRQSEKRRLRNRSVKKVLKVQTKAFLTALADGDPAETEKQLRLAMKRLDQAAAKRVIHPNAAARKKSQLASQLNAAKTKG